VAYEPASDTRRAINWTQPVTHRPCPDRFPSERTVRRRLHSVSSRPLFHEYKQYNTSFGVWSHLQERTRHSRACSRLLNHSSDKVEDPPPRHSQDSLVV